MDTLDPTLALLGLVMPPIVALIKQSGFSKQVNSIIALVVYAAATLLYMNFHGIPIDLNSFATNATVLTVVGLTAYKMFWSAIGGGGDGTPEGADGSTGGSLDAKITDVTSLNRFKALPPYPKIIGADGVFTT